MDTRVAVISIIVEDDNSTTEINELLSGFSDYVIGRMGVPYKERGVRLIWIEHDLMDPRTVSRKDMRSKVNEYMRTVMREEPLDPSLIDFEDDASW